MGIQLYAYRVVVLITWLRKEKGSQLLNPQGNA